MDSLDAEDGDDGFGPGSDLVLSFLGVVLLLIGVTVVTGLPEVGNAPARDAPAAESQDWPVHEARVVPVDQALQGWEHRALAAERELQRLRKLARGTQSRVLALDLHSSDVAFFAQRGTELREPARQLLAGSMAALGRKAGEHQANQLEIVGHSSPEPSQTTGRDDNLDLSMRRAEAVAHFLAEHGVPYECMSVGGVGRGRSELLYETYLKEGKGRTRAQWDAGFRGDKGAKFAEQIEDLLAPERRVEIFVSRDPSANCDLAQLRRALGY